MPKPSLLLAAGIALMLESAAFAKDPTPDPRGEARLARVVEGRVAGRPVDCLKMSLISSTEVIDRTAIIYHVGATLYVNRPNIGPEALDSDDILITKTYSSDLCRIDTVRLVEHGTLFDRGFVGLGEFVPYTRPAAK